MDGHVESLTREYEDGIRIRKVVDRRKQSKVWAASNPNWKGGVDN